MLSYETRSTVCSYSGLLPNEAVKLASGELDRLDPRGIVVIAYFEPIEPARSGLRSQ
jgi:hypothetical protein